MRRLILAAALVVAAAPLLGAAPWARMASDVEASLKAGDFRDAEKLATRLGRDLVKHAAESANLERALGIAMAYRALAALGQNAAYDAEYFWAAAVAMHAEVESVALPAVRGFEDLKKARVPAPQSAKGVGPPEPHDPSKTKARVLKRRDPEYPKSQPLPSQVVVVISVGVDGRAHSPGFPDRESSSAASRYATLDALKDWRFEPGSCSGVPCSTSFSLTVSFTRR